MKAYDRAINIIDSYASEVAAARRDVTPLQDKLKLLRTAKQLRNIVKDLRLLYFDVEDGKKVRERAHPIAV